MKNFIAYHKKKISDSLNHPGNRYGFIQVLIGYCYVIYSKIFSRPIVVSVFQRSKFAFFPYHSHSRSFFFHGTEYDNWDIQNFIYQVLEPGDIFIDGGANVGLFSIMARDKVGESGRVYSFEPIKSNLTCLEYNKTLNNFKNIEIFDCGLSDRQGIMNFERSDVSARIQSYLVPSDSHEGINEIECNTLDDILSLENVYKVVKLDTEGNELNILKGSMNLINKGCFPIIVMETNDSYKDYGITTLDIEDFLRKNSYVFGGYDHSLQTLCLSNKLHEDTIAIRQEYLDEFSSMFPSITIKQY